MSLFWTTRQTDRIIDQATDAVIAATRPPQRQSDQGDADERLDQLLLVCAAMWELIREKTNLTEEDLINRVAMLDARDGVADGKMTRTPQKCPKCNRVLSPKHARCLYCGAPVPIDSVFKTI